MMRQGGQGGNKRGRGRGPGGGGPQHGGGNNGGNRRPHIPNRNQNFDSNGPDVRIRGSAYQVHEKYLNLARDATAAGDRIMAESYYQHAEHYYRIINAQEYGPEDGRRQRNDFNNGGQNQGNGWNGEEPQPDFGQNEAEGGDQAELRDQREARDQRDRGEGQDGHERDGRDRDTQDRRPQDFSQTDEGERGSENGSENRRDSRRNDYEYNENDQPE